MRHAQLKAFHAVAQTGSFSRAATRLSLTQPAVSDHVRKLEETYGVQLFERGAKAITLTALGRKLFALSERQFEAESEALELLSRARTLEEGQLTIGADAAIHVLPHLVTFRARYPAIALRLVTGNSSELRAALDAFAIDIAVTADRPPGEAYLARLLRRDRLVAVAAHGTQMPLRMTLARLAAGTLILREAGSVTRNLLTAELQARMIKPASTIEIESREAAREAAAQGLGIAIMSEGELVPDTRLQVIAISDWQAEMEEWLLCLKARAGLHVIRSFLGLQSAKGGA